MCFTEVAPLQKLVNNTALDGRPLPISSACLIFLSDASFHIERLMLPAVAPRAYSFALQSG